MGIAHNRPLTVMERSRPGNDRNAVDEAPRPPIDQFLRCADQTRARDPCIQCACGDTASAPGIRLFSQSSLCEVFSNDAETAELEGEDGVLAEIRVMNERDPVVTENPSQLPDLAF